MNNPDKALVETGGVVATSDGWILDHAAGWTNLLAALYDTLPPVFPAPPTADFFAVPSVPS